MTAWRRWLVAAVVACSVFGCAAGLHPHTTLAGRYFDSERVSELRELQSAEDVRAILGAPLEVQEADDEVVWRYFEQSHPRGCTSYLFGVLPLSRRPTWKREALITFREGRVAKVRLLQE
jgi:outer membrane protein assembly factor BamE (lipoprotein component of BamABCDE complex)